MIFKQKLFWRYNHFLTLFLGLLMIVFGICASKKSYVTDNQSQTSVQISGQQLIRILLVQPYVVTKIVIIYVIMKSRQLQMLRVIFISR